MRPMLVAPGAAKGTGNLILDRSHRHPPPSMRDMEIFSLLECVLVFIITSAQDWFLIPIPNSGNVI
jgi:hypothetical protein